MPRKLPENYFILDGNVTVHDGDVEDGRYALYHGDPEVDGEIIAIHHDESELRKIAFQHERDPKDLTAEDIRVLVIMTEDAIRKTQSVVKMLREKDMMTEYLESQQLLLSKLKAFMTYDTNDLGVTTVSVGGKPCAITG
jgi:hypothetical protein